jgi:hypothetical protein
MATRPTCKEILAGFHAEVEALDQRLHAALQSPALVQFLAPSVPAPPPTPRPARAPQPVAASDLTLPQFAEVVLAAARVSPVRYSPRDVFISGVWRAVQPALQGWTEREFKAALVECHRKSLLLLARADLVAAMDEREVRASETHYLNATFHFVVVDR